MEKVSFSRIVLIAFMCAYMAVMPGCNKDSNPTDSNDVAPELPPIETMQLDQELLSFFNNSSAPKTSAEIGQLQNQNWLTAVIVVTTFNVLVLAALSIPVAVTAAALSVEPTLEDDGKWHWDFTHSYNVLGAQRTLVLELTGEVQAGKTVWEMYVTRDGLNPLDNFLWYRGEAEIGGEDGFWLFYNDLRPNESAELARIDWTFRSETDRELTITDLNENSNGRGNTLMYDYLEPDVQVLFTEASSGNSTDIGWNKDSGEGYIMAPNYNNGERACWDSVQVNVECPN